MIHARIDTVDHRQIVGFETGTRALFDIKHPGDTLWVFVDNKVRYRSNFPHFLKNPFMYKVDENGDIRLSFEPPIVIDPDPLPETPPGYGLLKGPDGRYLKGADGQHLMGMVNGYTPPPEGYIYLIDDDGYFLKDPDGHFLMEAVDTPPPSDVPYLIDTNGYYLTDIDDKLITE